MARWDVVVEVLLLRLGATVLEYRWVRGTVPAGSAPDGRAVELTGCSDGVCHSTSWRLEAPATLVLTYAALPDPDVQQPAAPLQVPLVVAGGRALQPSPVELGLGNVAAHAVRHLADLAARDPVVRGAAQRTPALWNAVVSAARDAQHEQELTSRNCRPEQELGDRP